MSGAEIFFVVAAIASILAIPLAIYLSRRSQRQKVLVYRSYLGRLPLLSARSLRDYRLSVVFEPEGGPEERIQAGYVHFLGFANLGKEPIRRADIAPANPLRLEVTGARVLDIALEAVHRTVSDIAIQDASSDSGESSVAIDFDFLDFRDGGLVRVLTTSPPDEIRLAGDIVGMPNGVVNANNVRRNSLLSKIGTGLVLALFAAALVMMPIVVWLVTGSWSDTWILAIPFVAILFATSIAILVNLTVWPKGPQLPHELLPRFRNAPGPIYWEDMYFRSGPITFEVDQSGPALDESGSQVASGSGGEPA